MPKTRTTLSVATLKNPWAWVVIIIVMGLLLAWLLPKRPERCPPETRDPVTQACPYPMAPR